MRNSILVLSMVALAPIIFAPGLAFADTFYIRDDYPTIQAALDGVVNGEEIIVRDGTWKGTGNKNLDFKGMAITLRSTNGPENCIIDCESDGRGFDFHTGEPPSSMVDGFTIRNGYTSGHLLLLVTDHYQLSDRRQLCPWRRCGNLVSFFIAIITSDEVWSFMKQ